MNVCVCLRVRVCVCAFVCIILHVHTKQQIKILSFAEYRLFCRALLQNIVSFVGLLLNVLCRMTVELTYGVATVSSIDKITGLFCRISSLE